MTNEFQELRVPAFLTNLTMEYIDEEEGDAIVSLTNVVQAIIDAVAASPKARQTVSASALRTLIEGLRAADL
jgi:hypothetical protein